MHNASEFTIPSRSEANIIIEVLTGFLIMIPAGFGNVLVILAVWKKQNLRKTANAFYVSLAVSDILLAAVMLPIYISTLASGKMAAGEPLCRFQVFMNFFLFAATLFNLTGITVSRYVFIVHPLNYRVWYHNRSILGMIAGVWLMSLCVALGPVFGWGKAEFIPLKGLCSIQESSSKSYRLFVTALIIINVFIIMFSNFGIFWTVRKHRQYMRRRRNQVDTTSNQGNTSNNGQRFVELATIPTVSENDTTNQCIGNKQTTWVSTVSENDPTNQCTGNKQTTWATHGGRTVGSESMEAEKLPDRIEQKAERFETETQRVERVECPQMPRGQPQDINANHDKRFERVEQPKARRHPREIRGEEIHIVRTIGLIVLLFLGCWLPKTVTDNLLARGVHMPREVLVFVIYVIYMNSMANPIVYGIRNRKFRKAFRDLLYCW